jgi:hypothetical protein
MGASFGRVVAVKCDKLRQTNQTNINDRNCLKEAIIDKSRSKQAAKKTGKGDPHRASQRGYPGAIFYFLEADVLFYLLVFLFLFQVFGLRKFSFPLLLLFISTFFLAVAPKILEILDGFRPFCTIFSWK